MDDVGAIEPRAHNWKLITTSSWWPHGYQRGVGPCRQQPEDGRRERQLTLGRMSQIARIHVPCSEEREKVIRGKSAEREEEGRRGPEGDSLTKVELLDEGHASRTTLRVPLEAASPHCPFQVATIFGALLLGRWWCKYAGKDKEDPETAREGRLLSAHSKHLTWIQSPGISHFKFSRLREACQIQWSLQ